MLWIYTWLIWINGEMNVNVMRGEGPAYRMMVGLKWRSILYDWVISHGLMALISMCHLKHARTICPYYITYIWAILPYLIGLKGHSKTNLPLVIFTITITMVDQNASLHKPNNLFITSLKHISNIRDKNTYDLPSLKLTVF